MLRALLRWSRFSVALWGLALAASAARAQSGPALQFPPPTATDNRLGQLEDQVKTLERLNRELMDRYIDLTRKYDVLNKQAPGPLPKEFRVGSQQGGEKKAGEGEGGGSREGGTEGRSGSEGGTSTRTGGTGGAPGTSGRDVTAPDQPTQRDRLAPKRTFGEVTLSDGVHWKTKDDFFELTFHNLTQADLRLFDPVGDPLHDNFIVPRQRWYFEGHVSQYVNYYTVINRGYGALDLLDSWADFNIDKEHLQLRVGRMKTPYTYEYIKVSESDLIAAERSVLVGNLAPNREIGAMLHGYLCDKTIQYFTGVFNGPRRSFQDFNSDKDYFAFVNTKPFLHCNCPLLEQVNIGGSFNFGRQRNPTQPFSFRTANDQSTSPASANVSPTFLAFGSNVFENGIRMQWSGDFTWFYKSFMLLAGVQGGSQDYSISSTGSPPGSNALRLGVAEFIGFGSPFRTRIPFTGWNVALSYFLTGEEITRRVYLVEPLRPFGRSKEGGFGLGAFEVFSRFANLHLSSSVLTSGLTTNAPWSNVANVVDSGINWYLNNYVKLTFDYQYSYFPTPVFLKPGATTSHFNLFWLRTQIFF